MTGPMATAIDGGPAHETFLAEAAELYGILVRVVECADCADRVLARTYSELPPDAGARPTLVALVREALTFAYGSVEGAERDRLEARIRVWYMETHLGIPPHDGLNRLQGVDRSAGRVG